MRNVLLYLTAWGLFFLATLLIMAAVGSILATTMSGHGGLLSALSVLAIGAWVATRMLDIIERPRRASVLGAIREAQATKHQIERIIEPRQLPAKPSRPVLVFRREGGHARTN